MILDEVPLEHQIKICFQHHVRHMMHLAYARYSCIRDIAFRYVYIYTRPFERFEFDISKSLTSSTTGPCRDPLAPPNRHRIAIINYIPDYAYLSYFF